jgi:hypothetical protein
MIAPIADATIARLRDNLREIIRMMKQENDATGLSWISRFTGHQPPR